MILLFSVKSQAQLAIGLYEGLLGNSGAALSDSTAPSMYNPSLMNKKKDNSYGLSGNTLGSLTSKDENYEITSFALNPGYLSTIIVGTALVHEIFISSNSPSKLKIKGESVSSNMQINYEQNQNLTQFLFGYSMAFRSVPFALSYFGEFNQREGNSFKEVLETNDEYKITSFSRLDFKSLGTGVAFSGYGTFSSYTFGFNLKSRQWIFFKKDEEIQTQYTYYKVGSSSNYVKSETKNTDQNTVSMGSSMRFGHGFQFGAHEFTTDSYFNESSELNFKYQFSQSFGYKLSSASGHQFLCGLSHDLNPDVTYFGQSTYYSAGYSWKTNGLRSVLGGYVYSSKLKQDLFAVGLTFGSEFTY